MDKDKTPSPNIPLPDPDKVEHAFAAVLTQLRERRRFYTGVGVVAAAVLVGIVVLLNRGPSAPDNSFAALWGHYNRGALRLRRDLSAGEDILRLERETERLSGTRTEAHGLWLAAVLRYREAWLPEHSTFDDRRPHLEKAARHLNELKAGRFDDKDLLLDKSSWFGRGASPVERLSRQVNSDLEWAAAHAYVEPKTDSSVVAVLRTELGDIHFQFYADLASRHTENFITLAQKGAYNGTAFHFVFGGTEDPISVMGGDPYTFFYNDPKKEAHILRWGNGGVGYDLAPEESRFRVNHRKGIVTSQRVRSADWDNAMQFQIMLATELGHDRIHTPFAKVVEGMSHVREIAKRKTASQHGPYKDKRSFSQVQYRDLLVEPVTIHKVIVYENGAAMDHAFTLTDKEKRLSGLEDAPVSPLSERELTRDRRLRKLDAEGSWVRGHHFPFPRDIRFPEDDKEDMPSAKGERRVLGDSEEEEEPKDEGTGKPKDDGAPEDDDK